MHSLTLLRPSGKIFITVSRVHDPEMETENLSPTSQNVSSIKREDAKHRFKEHWWTCTIHYLSSAISTGGRSTLGLGNASETSIRSFKSFFQGYIRHNRSILTKAMSRGIGAAVQENMARQRGEAPVGRKREKNGLYMSQRLFTLLYTTFGSDNISHDEIRLPWPNLHVCLSWRLIPALTTP